MTTDPIEYECRQCGQKATAVVAFADSRDCPKAAYPVGHGKNLHAWVEIDQPVSR